jgi:hypothetical protein
MSPIAAAKTALAQGKTPEEALKEAAKAAQKTGVTPTEVAKGVDQVAASLPENKDQTPEKIAKMAADAMKEAGGTDGDAAVAAAVAAAEAMDDMVQPHLSVEMEGDVQSFGQERPKKLISHVASHQSTPESDVVLEAVEDGSVVVCMNMQTPIKKSVLNHMCTPSNYPEFSGKWGEQVISINWKYDKKDPLKAAADAAKAAGGTPEDVVKAVAEAAAVLDADKYPDEEVLKRHLPDDVSDAVANEAAKQGLTPKEAG